MFGRKKDKKEKKDGTLKKPKKVLDKIVMGAVIGGAIGSVVGASIAPKKGKDTRQEIKEAADKVKETAKKTKIFKRIKSWVFRDKKKIPTEE